MRFSATEERLVGEESDFFDYPPSNPRPVFFPRPRKSDSAGREKRKPAPVLAPGQPYPIVTGQLAVSPQPVPQQRAASQPISDPAGGGEKRKPAPIVAPGQSYPIVSGQRVEKSDRVQHAAAPKPVSDPVMGGAWIVEATSEEYKEIDNHFLNGIAGLLDVERKDGVMCFNTPDYKDEKKIKAAYAAIRAKGIPAEKILGYQRKAETNRESKSSIHNPNSFIYDSNAELTPYGMIVQRIDQVSSTWKGNPITQQKEAILKNFLTYYYEHSVNNSSRIKIIGGWVDDYKKNHSQASSPLVTLGLGRLDDCRISMFNNMSLFNKTGNTKSLQLFEKIILPTEKEALKTLMDDELGVKSSCFDSIKNCFRRKTGS